MSKKPEDYDGGLHVSQKLLNILNQPGYVSVRMGGQRAREMYRDGTLRLDYQRLSPFGILCFTGQVDAVRLAVEFKRAPPLGSTETPYKWGYATLTLCGAQQIRSRIGAPLRHHETLNYLISQGLPVDVPDIAGWTALCHAAMAVISQPDLTKTLLEAGADPNHQGRYGDVPLINAFQQNRWQETDMLLEHGADLDVPEADGHTPRKLFLSCGPQVTAVVQKHIQKRAGKEAPRTSKACDNCNKEDLPLKNCAKCQVARYCGTDCQRAAWPSHKKVCQPFSAKNTLDFRPRYERFGVSFPTASTARQRMGLTPGTKSLSLQPASSIPKDVASLGESKNMIIKVQVPMGGGTGPLFVYNKKRDFVCTLQREDGASSYDQLCKVVREKGAGGLKAYFAAELKSQDDLVIKVSEVLADQPF